jgi:hypothetical protein
MVGLPGHRSIPYTNGLSSLSLRVPRLACPTVFPALLGKPGTDRRLVVAPNR